MKVIGIIGWSGSGKTTLITALLPLVRGRGLRVSTIKHAHHGFDMDRPGKDTFRHRAAGAHEVLVASGRRWALLHEVDDDEPTLPLLVSRLEPVDLVLVEGFKTHPFAKLEVYRPSLGRPPIWPQEPLVQAVASDAPADHPALAIGDRVCLPLNHPEAIAAWILDFHPTTA